MYIKMMYNITTFKNVQAGRPGVSRQKIGCKCQTFFFNLSLKRRQWQHTPVLLPGESQGQGSLVGCHLWGCTESDTTEVSQQQQQQLFTNDLCMYLSLFWINLFCNNFCCRCHRFMWRKISHRVLQFLNKWIQNFSLKKKKRS